MNIYEERLIIRQAAAAKREREQKRSVNAYATRVVVPLSEWLHYKHGMTLQEWQQLRFTRKLSLYNEYQLDCVKVQMCYECPKIHGLENANTLF